MENVSPTFINKLQLPDSSFVALKGSNLIGITNDAKVSYSWTESRTKHREYLFGVIPLFLKNNKTDWRVVPMGTTSNKKRKWRARI